MRQRVIKNDGPPSMSAAAQAKQDEIAKMLSRIQCFSGDDIEKKRERIKQQCEENN